MILGWYFKLYLDDILDDTLDVIFDDIFDDIDHVEMLQRWPWCSAHRECILDDMYYPHSQVLVQDHWLPRFNNSCLKGTKIEEEKKMCCVVDLFEEKSMFTFPRSYFGKRNCLLGPTREWQNLVFFIFVSNILPWMILTYTKR